MSTRIIKNERKRKLSVVLTPFIPCSAKLPIISVISGYFFKDQSGLISSSVYFLAITIILISLIIINKVLKNESEDTYIFELPEYKIPDIKYVLKNVIERIIDFIKKAGTIIFICSIVIWFLLSYSFKLEYGINIENSMLAVIGKKISFIFYPILGTFSWEVAVSAIQGLVAKEQVISSMNIIAGLSKDIEESAMIFKTGAFSFFTKSSAYAFMIFNLFSAPCFSAIGAMRNELESIKNMFKVLFIQIIFAWFIASIVFNVSTFIGNL